MIRPDYPTVMKIIPVEMVNIGDITKLKAQDKKRDPLKKVTEKKKTAERKIEMPPPPPKLASLMPLPDMAPKPKPKKKIKAEETIKADVHQAPKITPKTKPSRFNSGKLAALLDKREAASPDIVEKLKNKDFGPEKIISTVDVKQQTLSIIDSIDKHISDNQCWNVPAGAKGAEGLKVAVQVRLTPDGKIMGSPTVVDSGRMTMPGQEFFRTAAESALRAVRKCAPYDFLPKDQYDLWKNMEIIFDPEHVING